MAQFWPTIDRFALNANTSMDTWETPDRYIANKMFDVTQNTSGEISLRGAIGVLYDNGSYNAVTETPKADLASPPGCSVSSYDGRILGDTFSVDLSAITERATYIRDCSVTAEFEAVIEGGDTGIVTKTFQGYFVWARVSGGVSATGASMDTSGSPAYPARGMDKPRGVFFGHVKRSSIEEPVDQFIVGYTSDGLDSVTIYESVDVQDHVSGETSSGQPYRFFQPKHLRLVCDGNTIKCYARLAVVPEEFLVFDIPDATQFPQLAGRCGMWTQFPRELGGESCIVKIPSFQIQSSSGTLLFRDEFLRPLRLSAHLIPGYTILPDLNVFPGGFSLMSAYTGDAHGSGRDLVADEGKHFNHLYTDRLLPELRLGRSLDTVDPPAPGNQEWGWYLLNDIALDLSSQRVRLTVDQSFGSLDYEVGVAVRFLYFTETGGPSSVRNFRAADVHGPSAVENVGNKRGYLATITRTGGAMAWTARIYKYDDDERVLVASSAVSTPGDTFTIELEVRDSAGTGPSFAELQLRFNGVPATLFPEAGFSITSDWVGDTSPVTAGRVRGFFYRALDTTEIDGILSVQKFEILDPTDNPPPLGPPDQLSVPMLSDAARKSGELVLPLSFRIKELMCVENTEGELATGHRYSFPKNADARSEWRVSATDVTYEEMDTLVQLITDNKMSSVPFDWTRADTGETFVVRIANDSISIRNNHTVGGAGSVSVAFTLEEASDGADYN